MPEVAELRQQPECVVNCPFCRYQSVKDFANCPHCGAAPYLDVDDIEAEGRGVILLWTP